MLEAEAQDAPCMGSGAAAPSDSPSFPGGPAYLGARACQDTAIRLPHPQGPQGC